ncbi:MAG: DNA replication/repair protein RecF [Neomegalonema sp.]|nr:DNA replication/repair protein RecF [Neomegalonema sp.]
MTFLRHLDLRQFRSHERLTLELDTAPVAIHGPNGAGKTNILEAISLLAPGRGLRGARADEIARRQGAIGWAIEARIERQGTRFLVETSCDLRAGGRRSTVLDGEAATQAALGAVVRGFWLTPAMDRLWIEGAAERRRFLDRLTLAFEPEHGPNSLGYEKAMRERNRLLKDGVNDPAWFGALERQMAEFAIEILRARARCVTRLSEAQARAKTLFPLAKIAIVDPEESTAPNTDFFADPQALQEVWKKTRSRDLAAGRTLIGPHRHDLSAIYAVKECAAAQCSTGEQKALLISLVLAAARALRQETGAPPLLLLDEVAAHLDQERRAALYDEICALEVQAWMTGTGAELFDALGTRARSIALDSQGRLS